MNRLPDVVGKVRSPSGAGGFSREPLKAVNLIGEVFFVRLVARRIGILAALLAVAIVPAPDALSFLGARSDPGDIHPS